MPLLRACRKGNDKLKKAAGNCKLIDFAKCKYYAHCVLVPVVLPRDNYATWEAICQTLSLVDLISVHCLNFRVTMRRYAVETQTKMLS